MVASEGIEQPGVGFPRRLLALATSVVWIGGALIVGWLLWPSSLGGCTTLTIVSGHSMEPTYYTGDLVVSRCGAVGVGDVIVYNPPDVGGARVIHRIIGGNAEEGWTVQGDNNDFLDPWSPTADQILGHAVLHIPQVGKVAGILLSPLTWISLLIVALAIVVWPGKGTDEDPPEDGAGSAVEAADDAPEQYAPAPGAPQADEALV